MQVIMNSSIAKLLNQSPVAAAVVNGESKSIWYNDAYLNNLKEYASILDVLRDIFKIADNSTYDFIHNKTNERLDTVYNNKKFYLLKEYRKAVDFIIISIVSEDRYCPDKNEIIQTEEYFFNHMPHPCVIFDFNTKKVETANLAFLQICGIPIEHISNMYISSLFHESTHLMNNYLNSSTPYTKTFLVNQYNVETNKIMIFEIIPIIKEDGDKYNKSYKVTFMMKDIFGEIETQKDQISEDFLRYQFLTRSISDSMLIVNNGIIIDLNNAACQLWKYDKSELINKPLSFIIPDAANYIDNASTIRGSSIRFIGIKKDKSEFSGALRVQTFDNLNQRTMVYLAKDLTDHLAVARIMENKNDFTREIFDTQPNMIAVFNDEHILTRCNKIFLDFFGFQSIEEAIHHITDISSLFIDSDDSNFITSKNKNNWFILPLEHQNIEYMVTMKDQNGVNNIFNIKSTLMENDTNTFYVVSFTNITETIERQRCLKEANNIISEFNDDMKDAMQTNLSTLAQYQKLATIGTMIGFITHQWKQPLNAIGLIAQNTEDILTEEEDFDKEDITDMMQSIMNHIMFMSETMENFKNFFKPEDISMPFRLSQAIKSIMNLLDPVLKKNNIQLIFDMPAELDNIKVFGFTNDLKQVIMNIVVNSKDAINTRKEQDKAHKGIITIQTRMVGDNLIQITITDNGTGLSKESLEKIYEMHYTTKGSQGTGIGMYMVNIFIEKMSGSLSVSNREDGKSGAKVIIKLPIHFEQ